MVRISRLLLWIRHALLAYVDDFLLLQETSVILLCATVMLAFFAAFGVPISWKKLQLGYNVTLIGWNFHFRSHSFGITASKLEKLRSMTP